LGFKILDKNLTENKEKAESVGETTGEKEEREESTEKKEPEIIPIIGS